MNASADIVCLSHLRWDFVYQRPNHLMARAARTHRVFFVEEPLHCGATARVETRSVDGVVVVRPVVPESAADDTLPMLRAAIDGLLASEGIQQPWLWYYTPMALPWTAHVPAEAVIYDCMDDLASFRFAPTKMAALEQRLIERADVVFTGGRSLYESRRARHPDTYLLPSSVDAAHFRQARSNRLAEPTDQAAIRRPRIGYFGVIDERIDLALLERVALSRPEWSLVMVGPMAKIDDKDLPRAANIHWLGRKSYAELPAYLAGWDVAMMPFALNDSTRYISPTKTPEYLSGGRPVVSTPITDVVHPYADEDLVHIASDGAAFVKAIELALAVDRTELAARADRFLTNQSWDATWARMERLVHDLRPRRAARLRVPVGPAVAPRQAADSLAAGTPAPDLAGSLAPHVTRR